MSERESTKEIQISDLQQSALTMTAEELNRVNGGIIIVGGALFGVKTVSLVRGSVRGIL